jgi:hypothetical protein
MRYRVPKSAKRFLVAMLAVGSASAASLPIGLGDGLAIIRDYDRAGHAVLIGDQRLLLTSEAEVSLERQLAEQRWIPGKAFGAQFNVGRGVSGVPTIDSIYVVPPRTR